MFSVSGDADEIAGFPCNRFILNPQPGCTLQHDHPLILVLVVPESPPAMRVRATRSVQCGCWRRRAASRKAHQADWPGDRCKGWPSLLSPLPDLSVQECFCINCADLHQDATHYSAALGRRLSPRSTAVGYSPGGLKARRMPILLLRTDGSRKLR